MTGNMKVMGKFRKKSISTKITLSMLAIYCLIFMVGVQGIYGKNESKVEMIVDSTDLTVGASANLSVVFTNASKPEIHDISGIDNFEIISSSQSSSTQIVNGNTTKQKQIIYTIVPKSEGTFELTGNVSIDGVDHKTNTLTIRVSKAETSAVDGSSDLYVKTVISKESAYIGEKIVLTYELYSRYNIDQYGFLDTITINNGLLEEVPQDNLSASYVTINGNKYLKYEAKKYVITPIKAGSIEIPSFQFQANITDGGFFSQSKPMYLQSEAKTLNIQEIPKANQPENYKGLVGTLSLESSYDKSEVEYGKPVTLHISITGNANLDILTQIIDENEYPEFTIYETDQPVQTVYPNNSIEMMKEAEIIIVPKDTGTLTFSPKSISYFDTMTGAFKELVIPPLELKVIGEKPIVSQDNEDNNDYLNNNGSSNSKIKINQTSYGDEKDLSEYFLIKRSVIFYGLGFLSFVVILSVILFAIMKLKNRSKIDAKGKFRIEQIKKAKGLNEQYDILTEIMKEKYGMSLKASTSAQRESLIKNNKVLDLLNAIVEYVEYGRYQQQRDSRQFTEQITELVKQIYTKQLE